MLRKASLKIKLLLIPLISIVMLFTLLLSLLEISARNASRQQQADASTRLLQMVRDTRIAEKKFLLRSDPDEVNRVETSFVKLRLNLILWHVSG